jgi:hypothetical protein
VSKQHARLLMLIIHSLQDLQALIDPQAVRHMLRPQVTNVIVYNTTVVVSDDQ